MALGDVLTVEEQHDETVRITVDAGVSRMAVLVVPTSVYLSADWEAFGHQLARRQAAQNQRLRGGGT